jgi:cell wall-associated NlpC family hydrolase
VLYIFGLLLLFIFSSFSIATTPAVLADRDLASTSTATSSTALPCQSVIEPGMALNCAIDVVAEVDTFSFNGSVGDALLIRVSRVSNTLQPWLRIYDPNGLKTCEGYAERFVEIGCTLPRSGVFTISVSDSSAPRDKTGNYRLYLQRLNNPGRFTSVNYGVRTSDEIAEPTEVDTYTLNGEVDDKLLLRMTRGSETVQPWLRLYTPTGAKLCEGFADRFFEIGCTLPSTGRYTLIVSDASAGRIETGAYSLEVQRLNNPGTGTAIAFGQTRSSRLDVPVRIATYTFSGTVDDVIFVRTYRTSDELQPWARVYTPSGNKLCEGFSERFIEFACQLPSSGLYTVIVSDATPLRELTGGYDLYIQRLNTPGLVQILGDYGQTVFDSIDQPTRVDTYVIDGKVDDQLLIRMRRLSDTVQPWMRVYSPTGAKICEGFADRFFEIGCTLPRTGRYTLLIADATPSRVETGAYSVYIQRLNSPGNPLPLGPGSSVTGAIQTPSGLDTYNFSGEVGARITIRMQRTSDTLQPWMRVYDPRGGKVCEAFNTTIAEIGNCELPRTGNYTLLVGDASAGRAELGGYALAFDCLSAGCSVSPPPTCSVGENGLDTCALQPGDILLQRWNSIENTILMTIGGTYFTHAAMYVGDGRVVEAVGPFARPEDQVIERSVNWWTNPAIYDWVVIRPNATEQARLSAVSYMRAMAADPQVTYSILAAKESDREVYCSQLVWRAYQRTGLDLEVDRGGTIANIATLNRLVSPDDLFYSAGSLAQRSTIVQRRGSSIDRTVWRWTMWILSPAHLLLVDEQGRRTGYDAATGTTLEEIPGVVYSGPDAAVEMISITDPSGSSEDWKLYVVGYDTGSYTIEAGSVDNITPPVQVLSGTTQAGKVEQYIIQDPGRSGTIDLQPAEPTGSLLYLPLLRR